MRQRIVKTGGNKYLAQVKENFFSGWKAISKNSYWPWDTNDFQTLEKYCLCDTEEEALLLLDRVDINAWEVIWEK